MHHINVYALCWNLVRVDYDLLVVLYGKRIGIIRFEDIKLKNIFMCEFFYRITMAIKEHYLKQKPETSTNLLPLTTSSI
jgi:hypothetical protein